MKWYFLFLFAQSFGWQGPFDTRETCLAELAKGEKSYFGAIDPFFYQGAKAGGLCFQAIGTGEQVPNGG